MFSEMTINPMAGIHESTQRLYDAARLLRNVTGQSAVARLLDVTPQVAKNWELRGVSEAGALTAQIRIGCDANWILGKITQMRVKPWTPAIDLYATRETTPPIAANNDAPVYYWPFSTPARQFQELADDDTVAAIDSLMETLVKQRASKVGQPPQKATG